MKYLFLDYFLTNKFKNIIIIDKKKELVKRKLKKHQKHAKTNVFPLAKNYLLK